MNEDHTDINARAYFIFKELFDMYAIEDPDLPGRKIMTPSEIAEFIKKATLEPCHLSDSRIFEFLKFDKDQDGKIDLEDFLAFYRKACVNGK